MTANDDSRLTDAELAEIAAREQVATPGPWQIAEELLRPISDDVPAHPKLVSRNVCTVWNHPQAHAPLPIFRIANAPHHEPTIHPWLDPNDAAFIAHARTDIPRLLAEVRALRAERDAARAELEETKRAAFERITAMRLQIREWIDEGVSRADMEAYLNEEGKGIRS